MCEGFRVQGDSVCSGFRVSVCVCEGYSVQGDTVCSGFKVNMSVNC